MSVSDRALQANNRKRHEELCREVDKDLLAIGSAGNKLIELNELGVYKETYKTFEIFARERFGIERRHAYRLMEAASVTKNICVQLDTKIEVPKLESQLREVAKAPVEMQGEVVKKVAEKAAVENRKPTAKDYKQVVGEIVFDKPKPKPQPAKPPKPLLTKDEQVKADRKKARSYAEYLQRSIDDLNRLKHNPAHSELIKLCAKILEGLDKW